MEVKEQVTGMTNSMQIVTECAEEIIEIQKLIEDAKELAKNESNVEVQERSEEKDTSVKGRVTSHIELLRSRLRNARSTLKQISESHSKADSIQASKEGA